MVLRGRIEHPPYLVLEEEKNFKFNITNLLIYYDMKTIFKRIDDDRYKKIFFFQFEISVSQLELL